MQMQDFFQQNILAVEDAVKIKCCYCDIKDTCKRRSHKESYEEAGWLTRCSSSPNRPGQKRKRKRKRKMQVKKS